MNRLARCSLCCAFCCFVISAPSASAGGVVQIGPGDCAGLQSAAAAAPANGAAIDIALARNGNYGYCPIAVSGIVTIDGEGASLQVTPAPDVAAVAVAPGGHLTLRQLNFAPTPHTIPPRQAAGGCGLWLTPPPCPQVEAPIFDNAGTLLLDAVAVAEVDLNFGPLFDNRGVLTLRDSTIIDNRNGSASVLPVGPAGSTIEIVHSTIAYNERHGLVYADTYPGKGVVRVANSILQSPDGPVCYLPMDMNEFVSAGGNVFSDDSCGRAQNDRVAADVRTLDFGKHGGVVGTLALGHDSPAIGNGLAANCEAADARGFARGTDRCDAGAYEFGGGIGRLDATGMSGLYHDPANGGHLVSVQRLGGDDALVIWNTFDQHGTPAWLYGVGKVTANAISVDQVAQNIGGTLQAGGSVVGATAMPWGSLQLHLNDCLSGSLSYASPLPAFGTGTTPLQRLALLGGVECAR